LSSIRNCSSASRTDGFRLELGAALEAAQRESLLLGLLLDQERGLAGRARRGPRPIPRRELALRIPIASVEGLAAPRAALGQLALLAFRALDAERHRLGELALRPPAARNEPAVRTVAHHQRRPAQVALAFDRHRQLGVVDGAGELAFR